MVCTIECALGCDTDKKEKKPRCECGSDPLLSRYGNIGLGREGDAAFLQAIGTASQQHVNDSGNEFLSKFLVFGMSSLIYKKHKGILTQAFEMVAADLKQLHDVGITIQGHTFFASTIGCKGDLKFHHQVGNLQRSYYNVGIRENHPICSLCLAGTNGVHFEDVSANPVWLQNYVHTETMERRMLSSLGYNTFWSWLWRSHIPAWSFSLLEMWSRTGFDWKHLDYNVPIAVLWLWGWWPV